GGGGTGGVEAADLAGHGGGVQTRRLAVGQDLVDAVGARDGDTGRDGHTFFLWYALRQRSMHTASGLSQPELTKFADAWKAAGRGGSCSAVRRTAGKPQHTPASPFVAQLPDACKQPQRRPRPRSLRSSPQSARPARFPAASLARPLRRGDNRGP